MRVYNNNVYYTLFKTFVNVSTRYNSVIILEYDVNFFLFVFRIRDKIINRALFFRSLIKLQLHQLALILIKTESFFFYIVNSTKTYI